MVLFISYKYIIVGLFVDYKCIVFTFYTSLEILKIIIIIINLISLDILLNSIIEVF